MNKVMRFMVIFILNLCCISFSYAACTRTDNQELALYLDMGEVVVNPNLNVGDVIATKTLSFGQTERMFYCNSGDILGAEVNSAIFTSVNDNLLQSNIPGVSIKLQRDNKFYPYNYTAPNDNYIYIGAGTFTITLYKTASYVGSGALNSGVYTWYGPLGGGVSQSGLTTYMNPNGTKIVSPSCSVASGAQQNVYLEPINYTELKTVGATAGDTNFSIQLMCSGGASLNIGYDDVSLTFTGTVPDNMNKSDGVLVNDVDSTGAKGVGVQVLNNSTIKTAIEFDKKYTVGSLTGPQESYYVTSNYIARYYRYGSTMTAGPVAAKMIFNITYD